MIWGKRERTKENTENVYTADGESLEVTIIEPIDVDNEVASVGNASVLVTGPCEGGDLLESNGDGTARVQDDDIIRSKTIAKVSISKAENEPALVPCTMISG